MKSFLSDKGCRLAYSVSSRSGRCLCPDGRCWYAECCAGGKIVNYSRWLEKAEAQAELQSELINGFTTK